MNTDIYLDKPRRYIGTLPVQISGDSVSVTISLTDKVLDRAKEDRKFTVPIKLNIGKETGPTGLRVNTFSPAILVKTKLEGNLLLALFMEGKVEIT